MRTPYEIIVSLKKVLPVPQDDLVPTFGKWSKWVAPGGNLEETVDALAEHLGQTEPCYVLLHALSLIYWRLGDRDLAMEYFHRCIGPTPTLSAEPTQTETEYATYDYDQSTIHHDTVDAFMEYASNWLLQYKGRTIIDAACGSGLAGPALRPHAGTLIGIDLSATMAARAQASGLYDRVMEADMMAALAAMPDSADAIICGGSTYYLADLAPFMASCVTALRPGGLLLFSDFSAPGHMGTGTTFGGTFRHCRSETHVRALAAQAGLNEAGLGDGLAFTIPCLYWAFRRAG